MFLGEYEYKIDQKGRLAIPTEFRKGFMEGIVLARGLEKCIAVYPLPEWEKIAQRLVTLPPTRSKARRINRFPFATAFNLDFDGQGRIALPPPLRQYAEIKDTVIIAGVNNYLEIWSEESWESEEVLMSEEAWQITESMETRS